MDIERLMRLLAQSGATVLLKADHERFAEEGEYWTLVISGPALGEQGLVRAESSSLAECLRVGLKRLQRSGNRWSWISEFIPE